MTTTFSRRTRLIAASGMLASVGAGLAGCSVEWGGGEISIEDPAPLPDSAELAEALEPEQIPLPPGPHLHLVRLQPDGAARLVPLAQIAPRGETSPLLPSPMSTDDPTFRARFDSAFLAPGTELDLLGRGGRMGTVVLGASTEGRASCPSVASGQAILAPGQDVPSWAFAAPRGAAAPAAPRRLEAPAATSSMSVAGPVLAERLIGGDRAFLARRVSLIPVELSGDTLAGMAATYLIADSLAIGPPGSRAVSLFFMARFEPTRGFIPVWVEVRRYTAPEDKEAFEYLDWISLPSGRLDVVRRYDASSVRLAASLTPPDGNPELVWVEPSGCDAIGSLETG